MNLLYYGDNLDVLRKNVAPESVDLVYLDPPFNSARSYNVLFRSLTGTESAAQIQAFDDTWRWSQQTDAALDRLIGGGEAPAQLADALTAMRHLLGTSDMMAYLVMMAPRLLELHRVLKPTGTVYLHCDPTASHYLKLLLDATFGPARFMNEVCWKRSSAHSDTKQGMRRYGRIRDLLLVYTKSDSWTFNPQFTPYTREYAASEYRHVTAEGRHYQEGNPTAAKPGGDTEYEWPVKRRRVKGARWEADLDEEYRRPHDDFEYRQVRPYTGRYWAYSKAKMVQFARDGHLIHRSTGAPRLMLYADEMPGVPLQDLWTDIPPESGDRDLGYPTQKPEPLLDRIIETSSNPGDVVLDPFCGCGTTVASAQRLGRRWIGIDVTYLAIDLIRKRLLHAYGTGVEKTYTVRGIPTDLEGARALFRENHFEFERWAVSQIDGQPKDRPGGDEGIDGRIRFHADQKRIGQAIVSVKGGEQLNPGMVRDLAGTVGRERAEMGVLLMLETPTPGMTEEARKSGSYVSPLTGQTYPKLQLLTVADLFEDKRPKMPPAILPYFKAKEWGGKQSELLLVAEPAEPYRKKPRNSN